MDTLLKAFREVGVPFLARQWKDENKIILMVIIPAAAFALTHVTNIVSIGLSDVPDWSVTFIIVIGAGLLISALYMLRKSKRAEIIALWDKRWGSGIGIIEEA